MLITQTASSSPVASPAKTRRRIPSAYSPGGVRGAAFNPSMSLFAAPFLGLLHAPPRRSILSQSSPSWTYHDRCARDSTPGASSAHHAPEPTAGSILCLPVCVDTGLQPGACHRFSVPPLRRSRARLTPRLVLNTRRRNGSEGVSASHILPRDSCAPGNSTGA